MILLTVVLATLTICCTDLVGYPAIGTLEWQYPADASLPDKADAIVVLSSGVRVPNKPGVPIELDFSSAFRCMRAAEVYHHAGPCLVVTSGGKNSPTDPGPATSETMKDFLVRLGVKPEDILVENQSRTTFENATKTWKRIKDRQFDRVVLVTDASHMLRSEGCFKAVGCPVIPVTCNRLAVGFRWEPKTLLPSHSGVLKTQQAFHEWVGILWYWLNGRLG